MTAKLDPLLREPGWAAGLFSAVRGWLSGLFDGNQPRVNGLGVTLALLVSFALTVSLAMLVTMTRLHGVMQADVNRSLINLDSLLLEAESDLEALAALLPADCSQARDQLVRSSLDSSVTRRFFVLYPGGDKPCGPLPEIDDEVLRSIQAAIPSIRSRSRLVPIRGSSPGLLLMLSAGNGIHVMAQIDGKQLAMAASALDATSADGYQVLLQYKPANDRIHLASGAAGVGFEVAGQPPGSATLIEVLASTPHSPLTVVAHLTQHRFARQLLPALPPTLALAGTLALLFLIRVNGRLAQRASAARRLREAVRKRRFEPVVQPIVDARSGRCLGGEVLMRLDHPIRGLVAPAEFIGLAEQSGLIGPMTEILMKKARDRLAPLVAVFPELYFSFNVTAVDLSDPTFPDRLDRLFDDQSLAPRNVMIELIERDVVDLRISSCLVQLRQRGYRIAIDDFGTGQSSLSVLARLACDRLKIDREFVRSIDEETINRPVLDAIIELSRKLDLPAIAEGVETQAQRAYLVAQGVAALQGYLIARPMPISDYAIWLIDNQEWAREADQAKRTGNVSGLETANANR